MYICDSADVFLWMLFRSHDPGCFGALRFVFLRACMLLCMYIHYTYARTQSNNVAGYNSNFIQKVKK